MFEIKEEHRNILIAAAILFVMIVIYISYQNYQMNDYMYGMWVADSDFCDESDLTGFTMMIGPSTGGTMYDYRKVYVLMFNEEGMLCNRTIDVKIGACLAPGTNQYRSFTVLDDDFDIMPKEMKMQISMSKGHMVLYGAGEDSDTIYASMYKDHDSTHKAKTIDDMA